MGVYNWKVVAKILYLESTLETNVYTKDSIVYPVYHLHLLYMFVKDSVHAYNFRVSNM